MSTVSGDGMISKQKLDQKIGNVPFRFFAAFIYIFIDFIFFPQYGTILEDIRGKRHSSNNIITKIIIRIFSDYYCSFYNM